MSIKYTMISLSISKLQYSNSYTNIIIYTNRIEQIIKKRGMRNWIERKFSSIIRPYKHEKKKLIEDKIRTVVYKPSREYTALTAKVKR
jgi:hypothetical protein